MKLISTLTKKNMPRFVIFGIDLVICLLSIILAYLVRFNFHIPQSEISTFKFVFPLVLGVRAISFLLTRLYTGIIRYTGTGDAIRILLVMAAGSFFLVALNLISFQAKLVYLVPFSIIIIEYLISVVVMISGRLLVKEIYLEIANPSSEKTGVIIYGAGEAGLITKRTLDRDRGTRYKVVAYIDDNPKKSGQKLEGIRIYSPAELNKLLEDGNVKSIIIAAQNVPAGRKQQLLETALPFDVRVLNVPPVKSWINGELSFRQIKKLNIEDLLGRDSIRLDFEGISKELKGKVILITGAAGSIGSEMARQIIPFGPGRLVLLDMAESPLYELELELTEKEQYSSANIETVIADIRNQKRMRNVFESFKPEVVFHAAAYKHVPVMELNPSESILNNVTGTRIVADLSREYGVQKFVMISTDKAVNPTNIMGATKRIAEIYIQSLNELDGTRFITTRFGNVLGSNGSVIPRFRKQIETGVEVTVTHPDITRFFMTISEACQLVLEAGTMGKGGEIYIFDMGEPVRISDLAEKMIRLSGLEPGKDISIRYTGLRPGEKLYEELLANEENTLPTHHAKIMIAKVKPSNHEQIKADIDELSALFESQQNDAIVRKMKQIVPEFISNNSSFSALDIENKAAEK